MKKLFFAGVAIALCLGMFSSKAISEERIADFGMRLGIINCSGCDGSYQIGADYFIPMTDKDEVDVRLAFSSEDRYDLFFLSGNYIYNILNEESRGNWYVGAGLGIARISMNIFGRSESRTKIGVNVLGGYNFENNVSLEAVYSLIDSDDFYGINIGYRFK